MLATSENCDLWLRMILKGIQEIFSIIFAFLVRSIRMTFRHYIIVFVCKTQVPHDGHNGGGGHIILL